MTIQTFDISVVVQGAVNRELLPKCLASIREYLPKAEIILSTWEGTDVSGLDYNKIVLNKDPGGADCSIDGKGINNCNREIVSTFEGIRLAKRKYVLKIRSDIILKNNKITKVAISKYKRMSRFKYFKQRIIVPSVYSRNYVISKGEKTPLLFHPSDWLYFGLKEDLLNLFNIPLTNEPEFSQWFRNRPHERNGYKDAHPFRLWKFSPEAYILTAYLNKNHHIYIQDKLDIDDKKIELSRKILINNFFMADLDQIGIYMPKYQIKQHLMPIVDRDGLYDNYHWLKEYKRFCNPLYIVIPTKEHYLSKICDFLKIKRRKR